MIALMAYFQVRGGKKQEEEMNVQSRERQPNRDTERMIRAYIMHERAEHEAEFIGEEHDKCPTYA
jgi:hypothetical protein